MASLPSPFSYLDLFGEVSGGARDLTRGGSCCACGEGEKPKQCCMGAPACRRGRDGISHSTGVGRRKERIRKGDLPLTSYTSSRFQTEEFRTHLHKHEGSTELVIPFIFHGLNMECPSQAPVLLHVVLGWWQSVEAVNLQEVGPSWREGVTEAGGLEACSPALLLLQSCAPAC